MYIEPLSAAVLQYISNFNIAAVVAIQRRAVVLRDPTLLPTAAKAVWWAAVADAERVVAAGGDPEAAARQIGVQLVPHKIMLRRSKAAINAISERVGKATDAGLLKFFNAAYRRRRLQAKAAGLPFPNYAQALAKLRLAVAEQAAVRYGGRESSAALIESVFGS
jgi:hypothetical protein